MKIFFCCGREQIFGNGNANSRFFRAFPVIAFKARIVQMLNQPLDRFFVCGTVHRKIAILINGGKANSIGTAWNTEVFCFAPEPCADFLCQFLALAARNMKMNSHECNPPVFFGSHILTLKAENIQSFLSFFR